MTADGDWVVPGGSQYLPPFGGLDDPAIWFLENPDLPDCMRPFYTSAILFKPPNSSSQKAPWWFLAQTTAVVPANGQQVDEGYLIYDQLGTCGYVVVNRRFATYNSGTNMIDAFNLFGEVAAGPPGSPLWAANPRFNLTSSLLFMDDTTTVSLGNNPASTTSRTDTNTAAFTLTSTSYSGGTAPWCGVAFAVPPSGNFMIHYAGRMRNSGASASCWISPQVMTGSTLGSGSVIVAASDSNAIDHAGSISDGQGSHLPVLGQTPGTVLNAVLMHRVESGTGTFSQRRLTWTPLIN